MYEKELRSEYSLKVQEKKLDRKIFVKPVQKIKETEESDEWTEVNEEEKKE